MAYDEEIADRIRAILRERGDVAERRMFGGLTFLVRGNMACGVTGDDLMVRVGADAHEEALAQPGARLMDFTGRPIRGMVYVAISAISSDEDLKRWVARGVSLAATKPPR